MRHFPWHWHIPLHSLWGSIWWIIVILPHLLLEIRNLTCGMKLLARLPMKGLWPKLQFGGVWMHWLTQTEVVRSWVYFTGVWTVLCAQFLNKRKAYSNCMSMPDHGLISNWCLCASRFVSLTRWLITLPFSSEGLFTSSHQPTVIFFHFLN